MYFEREKKMLKKALYITTLFVSCLIASVSVKAGSINANESSVISAAESTFEYNGKTYVANSGYTSQLKAKLSADDVDLTAQQASEAVGDIYSNVANGVRKGYLVPVTDSSVDIDSSSESPKSENKSNDTNQESNSIDSKDIDANSKDIDGDNFYDDSQTSEPASNGAVGKNKNFKINLDSATTSLKLISQSDAASVKKSILKHFAFPVKKLLIILTIIFMVLFYAYICIKRNFKPKRIIPQIAAVTLIFAGIMAISISFIANYCFFSSTVFVNSAAHEKYYNKVYKTLHANVDNMLESAGFDKGDLDDIINERTVYLNGKLALEATFNSSRTKDFMNIQSDVFVKLKQKIVYDGYKNSESIDDQLTNFSGMVQTVYKDSLKFTYADYLNNIKHDVQKKLMLLSIIGLIFILGGIAILLFSQKYVHRITRLFAGCFFVAGISEAISVVIYIIGGAYKKLGIIPSDYNSFFVYYLKNATQFMLAMSVVLIILGVAFVAATKTLKDVNKRNSLYYKA